ncbi:MAG: hypothetical protein JNM43_04305 [Planctomycetaceae bacterium]|nr:hypothetical protein [Planctomycetaceae bacterium]
MNLRCLSVAFLAAFFLSSGLHAEVRDRAVVSLTFDGENPAADSAKTGKVPDAVTLTNGLSRIASAFVPGSAGNSVIADPAAKQQIVVAHSEDLNRPEAVTVSGFFASLHPLNDPTFHGLFAKRKPASGTNGDVTNYGINYQPSSDTLQLYVNDGATGYKVAVFSLQSALGYRRRVHLTATWAAGDAPGSDADADADDVRMRLFVNGVALTPKSVSAGVVDGTAGWAVDASLAKCVNDTPVTIASSFADGELTRLICDDIHIFAEALSDEDAKALFAEVAGASAAEISAEQSGGTDATPAAPNIVRLSPHAAEIGKTSRIAVAGERLAGARLKTEVAGVTAVPVEGGNDQTALFDVTVDASVVPGRYLARCVTPAGVSNALILTVDRVPVAAEGAYPETAPAATFPVSISGVISGTEQKRLWFQGKAGQKVVAEVEARRIGSKLDPVVEIRSQAGAPLAIQWQQSELSGDARTAVVLPADGIYYAEVHDLQFQSPGGSPWRLLVGDLPPSAISFPNSLSTGDSGIRVATKDGISEPVTVRRMNGRLTVAAGNAVLPLPRLEPVAGVVVTEPVDATFAADPLDATFATAPFPALTLNGRIVAAKEVDAINLKVTAGQTLYVSLAARQLGSPLRAHLSLWNGDALVAQNDGESGANDPAFSYAVPEKVAQLQLRVRDLNGKGAADAVYRLQVSRTDRQAFVLTTKDAGVRLPANGSVPIRLNVVRQSPSFRYTGPIHLTATGAKGITIVPDVIPASEQNQQVLLMMTRTSQSDAETMAAGQSIVLEGRAEGAEPAFTTNVRVEVDGTSQASLTSPGEMITAGAADSVPATLVLDAVPPILFRGTTATLPMRVIPVSPVIPPLVRFEMITTEAARREDPNKPDSPLKPMVSLDAFQFGRVSQGQFSLTVRVPLDTPTNFIDAVIAGEFVNQPLAASSGTKAWSAPIAFSVDNAVNVVRSADPITTPKNTKVAIAGSIQRHPLYRGPVTVSVEGLPAGYQATVAQVPADQTAFSIELTVPEAAAAGEVPNVSLKVDDGAGSRLLPPQPVRIVVQ